MTQTYGLQIGDKSIADLLNPKADEIDMAAVKDRLMAMRRWSNNPKALTVYQHTILTEMIANVVGAHPSAKNSDVCFWCRHHDDHEAITGDIPGPIKALIRQETGILNAIEAGLDRAICQALNWTGLTMELRHMVHVYDKMSETAEWLYVFDQPPQLWNAPLSPVLTEDVCREMIRVVQNL